MCRYGEEREGGNGEEGRGEEGIWEEREGWVALMVIKTRRGLTLENY